MNREFNKDLMRNNKKLIPIGDVKFINVPKMPELGVRKMFEMIDGDNMLREYLPDNFKKKRTIDRTWLYNVINTIHPGYIP